MKKLLAVFLSLIILVFSFSGCDKTSTEDNDEAPKNRPEPVAQISPHDIDPGRQKDIIQTSDLWYSDKDDGSYLYFQKSEDFSVTFVNGIDKNTYACTITQDNHLISTKKDICDIIFYDAFNCYDFVKGEWYTRGNVEKMKLAFSGKTLVNANDYENLYIFDADGVVTEKYKGSEYTGTWTLIAETVMVVTFGKDDYQYTFDIDLDSDGNVLGFSQRNGRIFRFNT